MIESILSAQLGYAVQGADVLDVGCGNGDISTYFARNNRVVGVDVTDRRQGRDAPFTFVALTSEQLPFADACFDVVISHHVIEHVADQRLHLKEVHRVLRDDGVFYLATPNKTSPIMRGHDGNHQVLHYRQMRPLFEEFGFYVNEFSTEVFLFPKRYHHPLGWGRYLPRALAQELRHWYPSHMFLLLKVPALGSGTAASGSASAAVPAR
jgi:ubiquinone/menaquinone biosynthesis C-methylase UbiE